MEAVLRNAQQYLGTDYSQTKRNQLYPGGSMDCSSFVAAIWSAAGYPLRNGSGDELRTAYRQVEAKGFALLYPKSTALIGKTLPSTKGLLLSYGAEPGDLVFWSFGKTSRPNRITHVGCIDVDGTSIIHTANNRDKCCRAPLNYGETKIVAILRLQEAFVYPKLPEIGKPADGFGRAEEWQVRMLQTALNLKQGHRLMVDGSYGEKTEVAVEALNARNGVESRACAAKTWEALGFVNNTDVREEPKAPVLTGAVLAKAAAKAIAYFGRGVSSGKAASIAVGTPLLALPAYEGWREVAFETEGRLINGYLPVQAVKEL